MQLNRLTIREFLGISEAELDLSSAPVHLVCGANNSGKSTIRDALEILLTGKCVSRNITKKKDIGLLARDGNTKKMKLALRSGDFELSRTAAKASCSEKEIRARFGDVDMLTTLFSAHGFLDLDERGRRDRVKQITADAGKVGEAVKAEAEKAGLAKHAELLTGFECDIDGMEKLVVEKRREIKREIGELKAEPQKTVEIGGTEYDITDGSYQDYRDKVGQLKMQKNAALEKRGAAKLLKEPDAYRAEIAEREKELADLDFQCTGEPVALVAKELTLAQEAEKALREAEHELAEARGRKAAAEDRWREAETLTDKCPTCAQPVGEEKLKTLREAIIEEGNQAAAQVETLARRVETLGEKATAAREQHQRTKTAAGRVNELQIELHGLKESLRDSLARDKGPDEVAELEARVAVGEALVVARGNYEAALQARERKKELETERHRWDQLAGALGQDGEIRKLAAGGFSLAMVKEASAALLDGLAVDADEDWMISVGEGKTRRPECKFSDSERFRLGAGFAAALSQASGLGILVLDKADVLIGKNRGAFLGWLGALAPRFDCIIALASSLEPPRPQEWLAVWNVEGGEVRAWTQEDWSKLHPKKQEATG